MIAECPFCSPEIKKRVLREGKFSFVILSNPRLTKAHLLVIPKKHIQLLAELEVKELEEIFSTLAGLQQEIVQKLAKGCEIRQNYKPYFPNSRTHVNHLHFHLNPREENDELAIGVDKYRKPFYKDLSDNEMNEMTKLFSK